MWILYAFGSAVFAGITAILAKIGIQNTNSNVATAIRTIVVLVFAWLIVFIRGSESAIRSIDTRSLLFLVLSGLATGASWLCYFRALQLGDVNKVTPVDKASTILTMILAFAFLGEAITVTMLLGMVAIGGGTYLMIQRKQPERAKAAGSKWLVYALLSTLFASLTSILGKVGIANIDSNLGTAIRTIVVLVMAWVVVFATNKHKTVRNIGRKDMLYLFLSGIATGASWLCYYRALQDGLASIVVPIDKLSIVVTIAFSYFVLKEKLTKKAFLGLALVVGGTLILLV